MENSEMEKATASEDTSQLSRNRSFKSKQLVRSQAIRESTSPPRTASPSVVVDTPGVANVDVRQTSDVRGDEVVRDIRDDRSENSDGRQQVEIQITSGTWEDDSDQRQRTKRWLGNKQNSRDLLSNNPRIACVCGTCNACPHCRGRRRRYLCPTKQDSGIVCSDECPDCSDTEPSGGSNSDVVRKSGSLDEPTHYCRCPERKDKPKNLSLSRTDSDDRTDMSESELVQFIQDTLNKNARDRMTLLKIEKELHALINDTGRILVKFPVMTSYGRMLVHRCAALFELNHNIDLANKTCVLVSKSGTCGGRIPCTSFKQWCTATFPPSPQRLHSDTTNAKSILKRDTHSLDEPGAGTLSAARSKSLEQREREYERVRRRIFSSDNCNQEDSSQWQWLNSGPIKLLTPEGGSRNKLLKVQSLEGSGPNQRPSLSGRGPVSKSHSFGGYTETPPPRQISRQGSSANQRPSLSGRGPVSKSHSFGGYTETPPPRQISRQGSSANQRPSLSGRGPVSKSHSFGGYTETPPPRQISRQGDLASSSWRLSPSSSGYRTLSLHSTDSVTPSPTGGASPEPVQSTNTEGVAVMWAVTDFSAVPVGALVIHPQTGRPLTNPDGSVYHFDPSNPPVIDAGYTQADQNIDISNEKKRGRLEKQHSFIDNESECQLGEDCKIKCSCDFRRQESCHKNNSDKSTTQTEQKVHQKPPSPHKTRYEPSVEAANHNPAPDATTNHRPYEATNQKPATDHPANHRYDSQSYTNHRPYGHYEANQRSFEIQRPPSYDASQKYDSTNQRGSESANHRPLRLANHCTPEVQYISQQFQQGYSHEDVTSPQACQQPYLHQDMGHIGQVATHEPELRPMVVYPGLTQYYGYQTVHPEEQKQMPPTTVNNNTTFTIDPSYPYAPVDYATQCAYEAPPAPQAPPAAHRPYALYTPMTPVTPVASVEPIMQYPHHHYQYQDLQWQNMQPVVQIPHPTPKLYVPELYNIVQYPTGSVPLYPQYNVMYPQVIPQPYPVYQAVHQMPDKQDTRRSSLTSHRHSKRNSVSGSSRNTPLTATPEEKQVPYEESHSHSTNPVQNANIQSQNANSQHHTANLPCQNANMQHQNVNSQSQNLNSRSQNANSSSHNQTIQYQSVNSQSQNQNSQSQNQYAASHKHSQNLQRQNSGLSDQQSGSKDSSDLAAKIKQINDQMSQLNTRERDRDNYKRNEWKRRNSGNGILGSYPFNGRFVGRAQSTDDSQLSSAARAIVNSIRSMQASNHTHYQEVCGDYHQNQYRHRDHDRHRRDDKDTDRRSAPVYTPPYLLRQMSPGTWCRRSPAPLHPVLNPRRPHPDSRGGRR